METMTQSTVEREVAIAASPETVWRFLVEPELAGRWMGDWHRLEPEPGGAYRVEVLPGAIAAGEIVELDPPRRLIMTWGWEQEGASIGAGATTISFELVPSGDGTLLRFTHTALPSAEAVERHAHGWDHYLARLARAATDGDAGRDPWLDGIT